MTHVFSQPSYLLDQEFKYFWINRSRFGIQIYSYFYIYKFLKDPAEDQRARLNYFILDNPSLTQVLHAPKREKMRR